MIKQYRILTFVMLVSIASCGQVKNTSGSKQTEIVNIKTLSGKWRSESDAEYKLVFENGRWIELYGKDTTDNMNYKLSGSCNLKDSSSTINLQKAYLLFYSSNDAVQQCNEILNLRSDILSWMNSKNGKIFVFKKIK
jgi:hypothetical protein